MEETETVVAPTYLINLDSIISLHRLKKKRNINKNSCLAADCFSEHFCDELWMVDGGNF